MRPDKLHEHLQPLYDDYNNIIKFLIADVEARYEEFPPALFNEIRALHDHIARCYRNDFSDEMICDNIKKAEGHINRIILDCFKYLILSLSDVLKSFERSYRNVDLSTVRDGEFYIKYKELAKRVIPTVRSAKIKESISKEEAMEIYQEAYNLYTDIELLIDENIVHLHRARCKYTTRSILKVVLWIVTAIASGVVSVLVSRVFNLF
ncbi:MAG: hypothetical protein SNG35_00305 [Rikenellaceae bacterium]